MYEDNGFPVRKHFGDLLCVRYAGFNEKKEKRETMFFHGPSPRCTLGRKRRAFRYPLWMFLRCFGCLVLLENKDFVCARFLPTSHIQAMDWVLVNHHATHFHPFLLVQTVHRTDCHRPLTRESTTIGNTLFSTKPYLIKDLRQ